MRRISAFAAAIGCAFLIAACTSTGGLTPTGVQVLNTAVTAGQLFCANSAGVFAIVDALDAKAVTVTNKAASVVAATCPLVAGLRTVPVVPPAIPSAVPAIAVVVPAA